MDRFQCLIRTLWCGFIGIWWGDFLCKADGFGDKVGVFLVGTKGIPLLLVG